MLTLYSHLNWFGGASEVTTGQGLGQPVLASLHFHEGFTPAGAGSANSYTVSPTLSFSLTTALEYQLGDVVEPALSFSITPDANPTGSAASVSSYTVSPSLSFSVTPDATGSVVRGQFLDPTLAFSITPDAQGDAFVEPEPEKLGGGGGYKKYAKRPSRYPRKVSVNGDLYVVQSAAEEAALLNRLRKEAEAKASAAEAASKPIAAKKARRLAKRIERREEKLEQAQDTWLEHLKREDEELISLLVH